MFDLRNYAVGILISFVLAASPAEAAEPAQSTSSERLKILEDYEHSRLLDQAPEHQRDRLIAAEYDRLFPYGEGPLASMSDEDLQAAFKAAYLAAFFAIDQRHIFEMKSYFDALVRQSIASAADFTKMHDIFIAARMFDEANEIRAAHTNLNLEKAPKIVGRQDSLHTPSKLVLLSQPDVLVRRSVDLKGKVLVVIAHPLCHFSVNAIKEISEQPKLAAIFKNSVWLAPPGSRLNIPEMRRWNEEHPDETLAFIDQREDWPMLDAWATPIFYFLKDGKVIEKVEGWPPAIGLDGFYKAAARWKADR